MIITYYKIVVLIIVIILVLLLVLVLVAVGFATSYYISCNYNASDDAKLLLEL